MDTVAEACEVAIVRDETRQEQSENSTDRPSLKPIDDAGATDAQAREVDWVDAFCDAGSSTERRAEATQPTQSTIVGWHSFLQFEDEFAGGHETMASVFPEVPLTSWIDAAMAPLSFPQDSSPAYDFQPKPARCQAHPIPDYTKVRDTLDVLSLPADTNVSKALRRGDDSAESHVDPIDLELPRAEARVGLNAI